MNYKSKCAISLGFNHLKFSLRFKYSEYYMRVKELRNSGFRAEIRQKKTLPS